MAETDRIHVRDPVQWYEGQLLYPHHYQQMRREIHEASLSYLASMCPWYWGVRLLDFDEARLPAGILSIQRIFAVFPDGSILDRDETGPPIEIDLTSFKELMQKSPMTLHLAVAHYQENAAQIEQEYARYDSVEAKNIVDENTGDHPITMARLSLRAFLIPETKLSPRLSSFPLLKIINRDGFFIKESFIPPTTLVQKKQDLGGFFEALIQKIRQQISYLSERLYCVRMHAASPILEFYEKVYDVLISRIFVLEMLYESERAHPYELYKELNIAAGAYCALNRTKSPQIFGPYNHNDLKATFDPLIQFINEIVESVKSPFVSIAFEKEGRMFSKKIEKSYLSGEDLILGVRFENNTTAALATHWLTEAVIACDASIESIKEKRILGGERDIIDHLPEMGLFTGHNQVFAKIRVDSNFVRTEETLRIFNPSDQDDCRPDGLLLYVPG